MCLPSLTSTGLSLIHCLMVRGAAGSPTFAAKLETGARPAIRTTIGNTCFIIISNEFIHDRRLAQAPKFRCRDTELTQDKCYRNDAVGQASRLSLTLNNRSWTSRSRAGRGTPDKLLKD